MFKPSYDINDANDSTNDTITRYFIVHYDKVGKYLAIKHTMACTNNGEFRYYYLSQQKVVVAFTLSTNFGSGRDLKLLYEIYLKIEAKVIATLCCVNSIYVELIADIFNMIKKIYIQASIYWLSGNFGEKLTTSINKIMYCNAIEGLNDDILHYICKKNKNMIFNI